MRVPPTFVYAIASSFLFHLANMDLGSSFREECAPQGHQRWNKQPEVISLSWQASLAQKPGSTYQPKQHTELLALNEGE